MFLLLFFLRPSAIGFSRGGAPRGRWYQWLVFDFALLVCLLAWPVPVLICAGAYLAIIGLARLV